MAEYDNTNKGALWNKTAKSWLSYISWNLNVDWVDYNISMFKMIRKEMKQDLITI